MAIIIPEVFADAVNARLATASRVSKVATDFTELVPELVTCGDEVHFPIIDDITDAVTVTQGTPLTPATVSMTDASAPVKQVAHAVRIYDKDDIQVKGALKDKLAIQLANKMARAVDTDLIAQIKTASYTDTSTSFNEADIDGVIQVFGDQIDNDDFAGCIISPALRTALIGLDMFSSIQKTYAAAENGIVRDGMIGYLYGSIPVYLSANNTKWTESQKNYALFAMVKKNALAIAWQKQPAIEEGRQSLLLATDIVASEYYATKLVDANGVSILKVEL